jgi:hypothetical protein
MLKYMENQAPQSATPVTSAAPISPLSAQPAPTPAPAAAATPTPPVTQSPIDPKAGKSSKMGLIVVIVITLLLAGAGWFIYANYMNTPEPVVEEQEVAPTPTVTPEPTQGPVKSGDSTIDSESDAIDQTMEQVDADIKDVDSSLNDQADSLN